MDDEKVICRTPNPEKSGTANLPRWKFDMIRAVILNVLARGDLPFAQLSKQVGAELPAQERVSLGSLGWHVTTVKLELEVRGEIRRVPGKRPQYLTLGA